MPSAYKTTNTFTMRPSAAQIVSYLLFSLQIITFYVIIQSRYQSRTLFITMHTLYALSLAAQFITTLVCSLIDPSDELMIQYRNSPQSQENINYSLMLYCDVCRSYVQTSSRHCRTCVRCSQGFDHHCMWINNCIGNLNYKWFIAMIITTFVSMTIYIVAGILLWREGIWQDFLAEMIIVWVTMFIVLVFIILISNLMVFHIYLNCKGLTTYDFIMIQKQKEKIQQSRNTNINKTEEILKEQKNNGIELSHNFGAEESQIQPRLGDIRNSINTRVEANQHPNIVFESNNSIKSSSKNKSQNSFSNIRKKNKNQQISDEMSQISSESSNIQKFFTKNRSLKLLIGVPVHPIDEINRSKTTKIQQKQNWNSLPINIRAKDNNNKLYSDL